MTDIIEIDIIQDTSPIDAELDFKGEIIRADADVLDKVYNEGYDDGYATGDSAGYERGYGEGYDDAGKDSPMYYLRGLPYRDAVFPENYELYCRIKTVSDYGALAYAFYKTNAKKVTLVIDESGESLSLVNFCRENTALEVIDLTKLNRGIRNFDYAFLSCSSLKSIYGALDFSECTAATIWLNGANALEDIEFVPETIKISLDFYWCEYLTEISVQSIIDGLADLTGSTAQKVTFHATIINKLTETQISKILEKNWTFA